VIAEAPSGGSSLPSNTAVVSSELPLATFGEVSHLVRGLNASGKLPRGKADAKALAALELRARGALRPADRSAAVELLERLRDATRQERGHATSLRDSGADENLQDAVFQLERRVRFAGAACRD
jgi:hypothetical protein